MTRVGAALVIRVKMAGGEKGRKRPRQPSRQRPVRSQGQGDTVNTASRLESMTKQRGVPLLIGAATQRRLADPEALTSLGSVPVRGRDEEVEIFTTS